MAQNFTVSLKKIIEELSLDEVYMPTDPSEVLISSVDIDRPGLELIGFLEFFDPSRIMVLGYTEYSYLGKFGAEQQHYVLNAIFSLKPPCVIITRNMPATNVILIAAEECGIPILRSSSTTSELTSDIVQFLGNALAPRITRHGVLVEVYGEGCLLVGDSGIGKSEIAIELIKRGHRLVADDAVEIKRTNKTTLVGSSPENIRHFIELRGIGIVNARRIFGMGAVKTSEKVDLVINLHLWDGKQSYDRMGLDEQYAEILDIKVPAITVPVTSGRNLAVIVEVAAMNNRQKKMGYSAAQELLSNLGMDISPDDISETMVQTGLE